MNGKENHEHSRKQAVQYYLFTLLYAALPKWLKLEDIVAKMPPFFAGVLMARAHRYNQTRSS